MFIYPVNHFYYFLSCDIAMFRVSRKLEQLIYCDKKRQGLSIMTYKFYVIFMHLRFDNKMGDVLSYIKIFPTFLSFRAIFVMYL